MDNFANSDCKLLKYKNILVLGIDPKLLKYKEYKELSYFNCLPTVYVKRQLRHLNL